MQGLQARGVESGARRVQNDSSTGMGIPLAMEKFGNKMRD